MKGFYIKILRNAVLSCLAALVISCLIYSCAPLMGETGKDSTFSITISGGSSRGALTWDPFTETSILEHTITLTGGSGPDILREGIKEGQLVQFSVSSGHWDITVKAYLGDVLKAEGFTDVDLKPGRNDAVYIKMLEPSSGTPSVITIAEINGIAAPVTGETPATSITTTAQYSGGFDQIHGNNYLVAQNRLYPKRRDCELLHGRRSGDSQ